jgi:hypothetical protein
MSSIRSEQEKAKIFEDFQKWYKESGIKNLGFTLNPEMNPTPEDIMVSIMNSERAIREGRVTRVYELGDKPRLEVPQLVEDGFNNMYKRYEYPERTRFDDENPPENSFSRFDNE